MQQSIVGNLFLDTVRAGVHHRVAVFRGRLHVLAGAPRSRGSKTAKAAAARCRQPRPREPAVRVLKERMLSELPLIERLLLSLRRARWLDRLSCRPGSVGRCPSCCWPALFWPHSAGPSWRIGLHQPAWMAGSVSAAMAALPLLYVQRQRRRRLARSSSSCPKRWT